jgi:hypothetical protein
VPHAFIYVLTTPLSRGLQAALLTAVARSAAEEARAALPYAAAVEPRPPLTKREDFLVFAVIAGPIFGVTLLIIGLVVTLGAR